MADLESTIEEVIASLRPLAHRDGGDIKFVKVDHDKVYVSLHGACVGCPASMYTIKLGLEQAIKEKIPSIREVIPV